MRTVHPVLKRGGLFWDRDMLPVQAYRERYGRMQEAIAGFRKVRSQPEKKKSSAPA